MTEVADKPQEKLVSIINQGAGPMDTGHGRVLPGGSLEVPESLAKKLVGAYRHIKLASDIIPGQKDKEAAAAESASLKEKIAALEAQISELQGDDTNAKQIEALKAREADLVGRLQEFLDAKDKKSLEALQEKHAEAVAAPSGDAQ